MRIIKGVENMPCSEGLQLKSVSVSKEDICGLQKFDNRDLQSSCQNYSKIK